MDAAGSSSRLQDFVWISVPNFLFSPIGDGKKKLSEANLKSDFQFLKINILRVEKMFSVAQPGSPFWKILFDDEGSQAQPAVMTIAKRPDVLKMIMSKTTEARDGGWKLNVTGASVFLA